jgi:hypothetical protein
MAGDYTPVHLPGLTITLTAAGPVAGGDPVEVAGAGTVRKCAPPGPPAAYVGVAAHNADPGAPVTVIAAAPVHEGLADGPVNAGDQLAASTAAGRQVTTAGPAALALPDVWDGAAASAALTAAVGAARAVIGVALTTAADNATVRWIQR